MRWIALFLACAAAAGLAATAATARTTTLPSATTGSTPPLRTGLYDSLFESTQEATAETMTQQAGATYVRLDVSWASIAPHAPSNAFVATDPTSPGYTWTALDGAVSAADAAGLTPILDIEDPPTWGYFVAPTPSRGGQPMIADLADFATALATHYDTGSPQAHVFDVWNEPNFNKNLYPQDPVYYRSMVNAVADAVHAVDPSNLAVAGELAPFKHAATKTDTNSVTAPLTWMEKMFCISGGKNPTRTCSATVHIDAWSHHPYSDSGPFGHAKVAGGVELGDLPKMDALLESAESLGAIVSANPVQFWVTEFGWSSKPPNSKGVPLTLETRWMAESLYQMWKSGVTVGTWFLLQDRPLSTPFQSGLFYASNTLSSAVEKPLYTPFRFPFVAYLKPGGKVALWGRDATSDKQDVTIQRRIGGGHWADAATVMANTNGIFQATFSLKATNKWSLRAVADGSGDSQAFSLKVPSNENRNVTPFPVGGSARS